MQVLPDGVEEVERQGQLRQRIGKAILEERRQALERWRAKKARDDAEWAAEVAQFGEEGARRRRLEELVVERVNDQLPTSDLEELELEDKCENRMLTIKVTFRVDKKAVLANTIADSLHDFEMQIYDVIEKKGSHDLGWKIVSILTFIKADIKRGTFFTTIH